MRVFARRLSPLLVLVAMLGGCVKIGDVASEPPLVAPTATPAATATPAPTPVPTSTATPRPTATPGLTIGAPLDTPAPTATPDDGSQVIPVTLSDSLTIDPAKMTVTAGVPVRFEVTNTGALDHTFFIGTDKEQKTREAGTGEPGKDRFISVPPGQTVDLVLTFPEAGKMIAGCTIPGHYSGGMRAAITIKAP